MSEISVVAGVAVALLFAGSMWFAKRSNGRIILQERFATAIEPDGPFTECDVRFPIDEVSTPCIVRATPAGWYMAGAPDAAAKQRWMTHRYYLRHPVLIPWPLLEIRHAKFPARAWIRFDVPSAKVTFFVRQTVAMVLLRDAGRPLPSP